MTSLNGVYLPLTVLLPILTAVPIVLIPFKQRRDMEIYTELITIMTSVCVMLLLMHRPEPFEVRLASKIAFRLAIDGAGTVFSGLISVLWPIATLYSFEYMNHEERQKSFFMFYTMTFGVTLGISWAGNILTMYFFYELLTLVTIPLVIHTFAVDAVLATRKYVVYSLTGAALCFIGVAYVAYCSGGAPFVHGGVLFGIADRLNRNLLLAVYAVTFMGFGVKAAIFPFHSWLPDAGAAPTPVTALLHAVAVVKAGAFATIRLTYFSFGPQLVRGTWAQYTVMAFAVFTIVYGCSMAVKETHMKRRLAYSTVGNLSYVLLGVSFMTEAGLLGALCHMVYHAIMKISAFFCAGAIMHQTGIHYIFETNGFGKKMPWVYSAFTVSAIGLMGIPGTCGFISKWQLVSAALESGTLMDWIAVAGLLISALLTAIYMMTIIIRGYTPTKGFDLTTIDHVKDPGWQMIVPLMLFSAATIYFGIHSEPMVRFLASVAHASM